MRVNLEQYHSSRNTYLFSVDGLNVIYIQADTGVGLFNRDFQRVQLQSNGRNQIVVRDE